MSKEKRRLSKKAKETLDKVKESKELAAVKASTGANSAQGPRGGQMTARTTGANKLRPEKKKG